MGCRDRHGHGVPPGGHGPGWTGCLLAVADLPAHPHRHRRHRGGHGHRCRLQRQHRPRCTCCRRCVPPRPGRPRPGPGVAGRAVRLRGRGPLGRDTAVGPARLDRGHAVRVAGAGPRPTSRRRRGSRTQCPRLPPVAPGRGAAPGAAVADTHDLGQRAAPTGPAHPHQHGGRPGLRPGQCRRGPARGSAGRGAHFQGHVGHRARPGAGQERRHLLGFVAQRASWLGTAPAGGRSGSHPGRWRPVRHRFHRLPAHRGPGLHLNRTAGPGPCGRSPLGGAGQPRGLAGLPVRCPLPGPGRRGAADHALAAHRS